MPGETVAIDVASQVSLSNMGSLVIPPLLALLCSRQVLLHPVGHAPQHFSGHRKMGHYTFVTSLPCFPCLFAACPDVLVHSTHTEVQKVRILSNPGVPSCREIGHMGVTCPSPSPQWLQSFEALP